MANPPQSPSDPGRIIPAADVERIISRFGCLKRSQSQGIANLRYVHSAAWQAGYREGLERATAELAQFHGAIEAYRSGAASPVTELVFAVLRKVLGDIEAGVETRVGDGRAALLDDGQGRTFEMCVAARFERRGPRRFDAAGKRVVQGFALSFLQLAD